MGRLHRRGGSHLPATPQGAEEAGSGAEVTAFSCLIYVIFLFLFIFKIFLIYVIFLKMFLIKKISFHFNNT